MARRWRRYEEKLLIENYPSKTTEELLELFPRRNINEIRAKITRLKHKGLIEWDSK